MPGALTYPPQWTCTRRPLVCSVLASLMRRSGNTCYLGLWGNYSDAVTTCPETLSPRSSYERPSCVHPWASLPPPHAHRSPPNSLGRAGARPPISLNPWCVLLPAVFCISSCLLGVASPSLGSSPASLRSSCSQPEGWAGSTLGALGKGRAIRSRVLRGTLVWSSPGHRTASGGPEDHLWLLRHGCHTQIVRLGGRVEPFLPN